MLHTSFKIFHSYMQFRYSFVFYPRSFATSLGIMEGRRGQTAKLNITYFAHGPWSVHILQSTGSINEAAVGWLSLRTA